MGGICDASTAAEKSFRDRSGLRDGVTKSRVSGVEDLRRCSIICLASLLLIYTFFLYLPYYES